MHDAALVEQLSKAFADFRQSNPLGRKAGLQRIENICNAIRSKNSDGYLSGKCVSLLDACKKMARQRQPNGYDDSREVSFALGDITVIERLLARKESP